MAVAFRPTPRGRKVCPAVAAGAMTAQPRHAACAAARLCRPALRRPRRGYPVETDANLGRQARRERSARLFKLWRQMRIQLAEQLCVRRDLLAPVRHIDCSDLLVAVAGEVKAVPFEVIVARRDTEEMLRSLGPTLDAIDDPLQHAHVLAESGP